MAGISSLGVGSGVLTSDVIDQLKEADSSRIITPLENKIKLNNQKQDAYKLLSSLMTTFKDSVSALSYDTIFENKTVDVDGDAIVSVDSGASIKSFTLETIQLAKKEIMQMGYLPSLDAKIANPGSNGVFGVVSEVTGEQITVDYDENTTLAELTQKLTDKLDGKMDVSILQLNDDEYSMVITSQTGNENSFNIFYTGSMDYRLFNPSYGHQGIQSTQDAIFKFNGIEATRGSNDIDDLVLGVNFKLKTEGDISNVTIDTDTQNVVDKVQVFVDSYNALIKNISDMTEKNEETGAEGVFNSESFVKNIKREITIAITSMSGDNNSLMQYGLDLDRSGTLSFDKSVLQKKLEDDSDAVKLFFAGGINSNGSEKVGIFETINEKLKSYTGYDQLLSNFETGLKTDAKSLIESLEKARESLNNRYDILTKRFSAYDSIISSINAKFSSLKMMIAAANKSDS